MTFKLRLSRYPTSQVNCESRMPALKRFSASVPPPTPSAFINKSYSRVQVLSLIYASCFWGGLGFLFADRVGGGEG